MRLLTDASHRREVLVYWPRSLVTDSNLTRLGFREWVMWVSGRGVAALPGLVGALGTWLALFAFSPAMAAVGPVPTPVFWRYDDITNNNFRCVEEDLPSQEIAATNLTGCFLGVDPQWAASYYSQACHVEIPQSRVDLYTLQCGSSPVLSSWLAKPPYCYVDGERQWVVLSSPSSQSTAYCSGFSDKDCGPDCGKSVGNPINSGTGNKYEVSADIVFPGFDFRWTYNSRASAWKRGWIHLYEGRLELKSSYLFSTVMVRRPAGSTYHFTRMSGTTPILASAVNASAIWQADSDITDRLVEQRNAQGVITGWNYYEAASERQEQYDANGRLTTINQRNGVVQTLAYNSSGQLASVTDSFGRSLTFAYNAAGQLSSVTDAAGNSASYAYTTTGNLFTVTHSSGGTKTYVYNEPSFTQNTNQPFALTGIIDENGARYATYKYDNQGRAISTEHAGGVSRYGVSYTNPNASGLITDPLNIARTFNFQRVLGVLKTTGVSQPCGTAGCSGTVSTSTAYDANGNVASRTDFNNKKTCYAYNSSRNLETARVEGLPSAATCSTELAKAVTAFTAADQRKVETTWHATYRLPATIIEPAAAATIGGTAGTKTTVFNYDTSGNLLQKDVTAPKNDGSGTNETRSWKWTYNTLGQVLTARDPLDQQTTTVYYPATDTAVPPKFTKGDVQTITNAAGHVTTFNEYDKNGRLTKLTDANGLVITMTYHPRGWLTSRAVNNGNTTETTTYDYDNVGQLTRVTLPDGAALNYAYDDAHRLVGMSDGNAVAGGILANLTGSQIVYTLDNMGNRTEEFNYDQSGTIKKARSRIIDGLNRLQQDIGGTTYTTAPTSAITQYGYDNNGNLTSTTDPLSRVTTNGYDALNRLVSVIDPYNGASKPTQYQYDQPGNLVRVTDPEGKATDYTYNGHNNLITQLSPDTGTTKFKYNVTGNVVAKFDASNRCSASTYDNLNRVSTVKYYAASNSSTNTQTLCFGTIAGGVTAEETVTYTYDAVAGGAGTKGRVTQIVDNAGTLDYVYDKNGRVTVKKHSLASAGSGGAINLVKSVTYNYNASGQLASMVTPSGQTISYIYGYYKASTRFFRATNYPGKLIGIQVNGIDVVKNAVYEPFGPNGGWVWGNDTVRPVGPILITDIINHHLRVFDLDYRPIAISSDPDGYNRNITWDQANRITAISIPGTTTPSITVPGVSNAFSLNQAFAYDQLDRITAFNAGVAGATTDTTGMALLPNESFTYDGIGNRKTRGTQAPGATSTQSTSYAHGTGVLNSNHRLVNSAGQIADSWNYDNTGNATYESNAALWGGYGSSGSTTSPVFGINSVGSINKALANQYDAKNRLTKTAIAAANTTESTTQASADTVIYRINALGQRVQKIGAGTFAYPTAIPFTTTLSNPPTQAQLQALNQQVTAFHANSRFVYDEQGRLLGEYSKDGKLIQETVWFDDLPVAVLKPYGVTVIDPVTGILGDGKESNNTGANGNTAPPAAPSSIVAVEVFNVHPDHLGTPRVVTASTALNSTQGTGITSAQTVNKAVWRWDSDPFGSNATSTSSPNENPNTLNQVVGTATLPYLFSYDLAFPGQKRDRESGKHYNYFRDYDPAIGRYVESDPIGLWGGLSTFAYGNNNPTNFIDPKGTDPWGGGSGQTWYCTAPLHAAPQLDFGGSGPFHHGFLCTSDGNCGGQDRSGNPLDSPGKPSEGDKFNAARCEPLPRRDDKCVTNCVFRRIYGPRPRYRLIPYEMSYNSKSESPMCQEWAWQTIRICTAECK